MSGFDGRETLYSEVRPALLRYVTRLAGDADLAEDVVQDAFVRLSERPHTETTNLRGWLFTVATNLVRDSARTARRRLQLSSAVGDRVSADPPPDPATQVAHKDTAARVRAALDQLSEKERVALLMREEGFRHREIAEAVGTTTASVGTLLARALEKMARRLEGKEG